MGAAGAFDGGGSAAKINIPVARAGIDAIGQDHGAAVGDILQGMLNRGAGGGQMDDVLEDRQPDIDGARAVNGGRIGDGEAAGIDARGDLVRIDR